jgi:hypothetical protein
MDDWTYPTAKGLESDGKNWHIHVANVNLVYTMSARTLLTLSSSFNRTWSGMALEKPFDYKASDVGLPTYLDAHAGALHMLPEMDFTGYNFHGSNLAISTAAPAVTKKPVWATNLTSATFAARTRSTPVWMCVSIGRMSTFAASLVRFTHGGWQSQADYFVSCNTVGGELMFRLRAEAEGKARGPLFLRGALAYACRPRSRILTSGGEFHDSDGPGGGSGYVRFTGLEREYSFRHGFSRPAWPDHIVRYRQIRRPVGRNPGSEPGRERRDSGKEGRSRARKGGGSEGFGTVVLAGSAEASGNFDRGTGRAHQHGIETGRIAQEAQRGGSGRNGGGRRHYWSHRRRR